MKKTLKSRMILLSVVLSLLLNLCACGGEESSGIRLENASLTDAVLYTVSGRELQYNVVYSGNAAKAVIADESGSGIDSLKKLEMVLGIPDAPALKHTEDPGTRTLGKAVTADITTDSKGNITALTVKTVTERPVIGITWKMDSIGSDDQDFAQALERNGALAVYLPLVISEDHANMVLSRLDGIFVTGGEDWNPGLYGQEPVPHGAADCNDIRDMSDQYLIRQALDLDLPMLCVCRGMQGLNVALGGRLLQDVPSYLGAMVTAGEIEESRVTKILSGTLPSGKAGVACGCESENHLRVQVDGIGHEKADRYHSLETGIEKDSKWLYEIFDSESVKHIATAHHQAIDPEALGQGLTVAAKSVDGIIEAVEYQDNLFVLGLQWHPERDALADSDSVDVSQEQSNLPLRALVKYAAVYAAR